MQNTTIQARIDVASKEKARDILNSLGLSMSEAIYMYIRQIILQKGIPFEIKLPNKETTEAIDELEAGKGVKFSSADDFLKDLKS